MLCLDVQPWTPIFNSLFILTSIGEFPQHLKKHIFIYCRYWGICRRLWSSIPSSHIFFFQNLPALKECGIFMTSIKKRIEKEMDQNEGLNAERTKTVQLYITPSTVEVLFSFLWKADVTCYIQSVTQFGVHDPVTQSPTERSQGDVCESTKKLFIFASWRSTLTPPPPTTWLNQCGRQRAHEVLRSITWVNMRALHWIVCTKNRDAEFLASGKSGGLVGLWVIDLHWDDAVHRWWCWNMLGKLDSFPD